MARAGDRLVPWLFLRLLGLIYLVAFVSLWEQVRGLIGADGILPVSQFLAAAAPYADAHAGMFGRYHLLPTLSWLNGSDGFLIGQCAAGALLSALVVAGIATGPCLALLWLLYLSLAAAGQDFLGFQWDNLLLEAGFLAIVLAPWRWLSSLGRQPPPSRIAVWLLRWLLFRLMFESGCVKLLSGDTSWRSLTALTVHYQTQPLPTWIGWYVHQLPPWFQEISCAAMFAIELGAPFLIFAPRRLRFAGAGLIAGFQTLILLTGNYTFFNGLTLALCLLLLDDAIVLQLLPARLRALVSARLRESPPVGASTEWSLRRMLAPAALAILVVPVSLTELSGMFGAAPDVLAPVETAARWLAPFRTINNYGLFAVMTTTRSEIVVQGSDDGSTWRTYEFRYKPGDVMRRPAFVAPFQPRLDWQMWFAALGSARDNPWFQSFCARLLQGSAPVTALLAANPFPAHPPKYIRAELYDYRFTTWAERRATGAWWARTEIGEYLPAVALR